MPCLRRLQDEAQPGIRALVLHTPQAPSSALEADPASLAQAHPFQGAIGPCRQGLRQHGIHVVGDPGPVQALGRVVQRVLREPVLRSQRRKGALSVYLLAAGNGAGRLPGRIGAHVPEPPLPLREDGIVELACGFQMCAQALRLAGGHLERQFQEKGRRRFARVGLLLCARLPFPGHRMEASFSNL